MLVLGFAVGARGFTAETDCDALTVAAAFGILGFVSGIVLGFAAGTGGFTTGTECDALPIDAAFGILGFVADARGFTAGTECNALPVDAALGTLFVSEAQKWLTFEEPSRCALTK